MAIDRQFVWDRNKTPEELIEKERQRTARLGSIGVGKNIEDVYGTRAKTVSGSVTVWKIAFGVLIGNLMTGILAAIAYAFSR